MLVKWRSLLLTLAFTILAAIAAAPSPLDRMIEMGIGHLAWRPVSGDIVVVGVDDKTLEFVTSAHETIPLHTEIVKKIDSAGAQRLFVDFTYDGRVNDPHFAELAGAIRTMGDRAVLAVAINSYSGNDAVIDSWPPPAFGTAAQLACICWEYRYWQVWDIPLAVNSDGKTLPTFASILSHQINPQAQQVPIDYSYNTLSIPTYSALD